MIETQNFKKIIPTFGCLLLILFSQIPSIKNLFLPVLFIPIFYFAIFNPQNLNTFVVFGLGLIADLLSQTPFGLFSFIFVSLFFIARLNQLFLKELSFKNLWMFFGICSLFLLLLEFFIFTVCAQTVVNTHFLFRQYVILILIYPLGFWACIRLQNWIGDEI